MKQRSERSASVYKRLVICFLIVDIYCLSFFVLAKPCKNINRATPSDEAMFRGSRDLPPFPSATVLCVSESPTINKIGFWIYRPIGWLLNNRGFALFVYDPTKEVWEQS